VPVLVRNGGRAQQGLVRFVVSGQRSKGDPGGAEAGRELLQSIGPVALATENAGDHQTRFRSGLVEIEIDRHRMREVHERGQPEIGRRVHCGAGLGEGGQFGVGGGDDDHVRRGLLKVDGLGPVGRLAWLCEQEMHQRAFSMKTDEPFSS
jgi:hypothetical protein